MLERERRGREMVGGGERERGERARERWGEKKEGEKGEGVEREIWFELYTMVALFVKRLSKAKSAL